MASRLIRINQWEILYPEFKADKFLAMNNALIQIAFLWWRFQG